jgi:hypothetical protein
MREPLRQAKFVFVRHVIVFVERTAYRATMRTIPTLPLNDLVRSMVRLETREILFLDCRIAVKCFHVCSL